MFDQTSQIVWSWWKKDKVDLLFGEKYTIPGVQKMNVRIQNLDTYRVFRFDSISFIPQREQLKLDIHMYLATYICMCNVLHILIIPGVKIHTDMIFFCHKLEIVFKNLQLFVKKSKKCPICAKMQHIRCSIFKFSSII